MKPMPNIEFDEVDLWAQEGRLWTCIRCLDQYATEDTKSLFCPYCTFVREVGRNLVAFSPEGSDNHKAGKAILSQL